MPSMKHLLFAVLLGLGGGYAYQNMKGDNNPLKKSAETDSVGNERATGEVGASLWERIQGAVSNIRPSQLEELSIEQTGTSMDIYPQSFDPAFVGSNSLANAFMKVSFTTFKPSPYGV